jgi:hypothetical protein
MLAAQWLQDAVNSITVAGAAPGLSLARRTGFPCT